MRDRIDYDDKYRSALHTRARQLASKIKKIATIVIVAIVVIAVLTQSWYTVNEQQSAVVLTAGKVTSVKDKGAGLQFKIPFMQTVKKVNMTTNGMEMGYTTNQETDNSLFSLGNPDIEVNESESMMITNDFNIVSADFYIEWYVTDPVKALYASTDVISLLQNIIQGSARDVIGTYSVNDILTDKKSEIQVKIKDLTNEILGEYDVGIHVANIIIQDTEPPNENVNLAFKAVNDAESRKNTLINEATKYYNEQIPAARAEANRIKTSAQATKEARINEAEGQVSRFNAMFEEYKTNKTITKSRMYYETMEEILPSLKVYIDSSGSENSNLLKLLNITDTGGEK